METTTGNSNLTGKSFNEASSYTATGVARRRALYTDIKYSKEISELLEKEQKEGAPDGPQQPAQRQVRPEMIPYFEARYKLTDLLFKQTGITQILEMASGFSPRGLIFSGTQGTRYVEMDLKNVAALKEKIIRQICKEKGISFPKNLFFQQGNPVISEDFEKACQYLLPDERVAIECEGFLRYVSFEDKDPLLANVHAALVKHGGIWITPDIELLCEREALERAGWTTAGLDVSENIWTDLPEATKYFNERDFKVEHYSPLMVIDKLVSPKILELDRATVETVLGRRHAFVLQAA